MQHNYHTFNIIFTYYTFEYALEDNDTVHEIAVYLQPGTYYHWVYYALKLHEIIILT